MWHSESVRAQLSLLVASVLPALAVEADALSVSARIQARALPFGAILSPVFKDASSSEIAGYSRCGDSAIWTGHYIAAEAYRYAATKSPVALDNLRRALDGVKLLFDVTGTDTLARCAFPADSPFAAGMASEESHNGVFTATLNGKKWTWIGHTSRDQYIGVFLGLTVVWNVVDDPGVLEQVRGIVPRAVDRLTANNWSIVLPDGISTTFVGFVHQQLMIAKLARRVDPGHYNALYSGLAGGAIEMLIPILIDTRDDSSSYFKFNLDYAVFYGLLAQGYVGSNVAGIARRSYESVRGTTETHGNAHFNMMDNAIRGNDAKRDGETQALLKLWLQRPLRDDYVDLRGKYPACGPADKACQPIPVAERVRTDFLWQRSPYLLYGGGTGVIEGPGIDYILPYWMGRFFRVITD